MNKLSREDRARIIHLKSGRTGAFSDGGIFSDNDSFEEIFERKCIEEARASEG